VPRRNGKKMTDLLTTKELAAKWGISARYVTQLVRCGRIKPMITYGRMFFFSTRLKKPEPRPAGRPRKIRLLRK